MHILGTATTQPTMSGMMFACWSIVIVLIAMLVVFMRAEKVNYAVATSPLLIQPLMYVVSGRLAAWAAMVLPLGAVDIRVILNVIAALVACLLLVSGLCGMCHYSGYLERTSMDLKRWESCM